MKLEVIKSYTLAILVGISLILSFSLWSYQSEDAPLEEDDALNEEEINLGGEVESRRTLVQPSKIIFDDGGNYYGFMNPINMEDLYEDMKSWVLYNFRVSDANGRPNEGSQVEIIYPIELPMAIIPSLFTVNDIENVTRSLPDNLSFQRTYITFNNDHTLTFIFLSTDGEVQIKADVNNAQKYELLFNYMEIKEGLEEYGVIVEEEFPTYLPINPITPSYTFNVATSSKLDPNILKNALFIDPSRVFTNVSEDMDIWYQDSQRLMKVFENKLNMEYINPHESFSYNPMTFLDLLDQSIDNINGYKGWVQDYHLESINTMDNFIRYQMFYRGYPVFNHDGLSTIEQIWINSDSGMNNELQQHRQPLFTINNTYSDSYTLPSGKEIINYLKENSIYKLNEIKDIQVGYRLGYEETTDQYIRLSLTPSWYIKTNGKWEQINVEIKPSKGVS
ncbi:YycH family regulatory protein [Paucisalibacillus sp. EB02]|uniref:YycH family regulatory protein n=1 Tax=Paucisalibacillus sp. EB02 TaxID=1347087 RepID=UPI0004BA56E8|nr:two-component system activity regulator YycH [Paucisalibacillus sp. EB02]